MSIPVLMYHHILPKDGFITTGVENFEKQMSFIQKSGYYSLSSEEFYRYKLGKFKTPKKSLFITFDDGWRDNIVYAYPILKKYNLKATIFIVTDWIEAASKKYKNFEPLSHSGCKKMVQVEPNKVVMSWNDIEKTSDVFDFHSHTATHRDFYFGNKGWAEDIQNSREIIQKRLGFYDKHLCWPRGKFDENLIKIAEKSGYELLYTTQRGVNLPDKNLRHIKRLAVKKDEKWLRKNITIFSNNLLGRLYAKIKPE